MRGLFALGGRSRSQFGVQLVFYKLLEQPSRRSDAQRARFDVHSRDNGLHKRNKYVSIIGFHREKVLGWKVIDLGDRADFYAISEDCETNELVVVPGIFFFGKLSGVLLDPKDRLDECLSGAAVRNIFEEPDGVAVVPAQFDEFESLAMPGVPGGNLQGEHGTGDKTSLRVVRVKLDFECAFEAVRLCQTPDAELRAPGGGRFFSISHD